MRRLWKPLLGLVVVLAAFTISFGWPIQNGLQIDIDTSPRAMAARQKTPWDLTKLQVMNRVIHSMPSRRTCRRFSCTIEKATRR
jgi:hypothetical protein